MALGVGSGEEVGGRDKTMPATNTNTQAWINPEKDNGRGRFLRHLLFGADLDSTNLNPRFKYPIRLQPVASNTTDLLTLDEDYNGIAFSIDSEATTADVVNISAAALTTANVIDIPDADLLTSGKMVNLVSNAPSSTARVLVQITNDHTSATAAVGLQVTNDSTGDEAQFTSNAAGAVGAKIKLRQLSASAADDDVTGRILFTANDEETAPTETTVGQIDCLWTDATSASYSSRFIFYTSTSAAQNEAMRLLDTGKLQVDLASEVAGTTGVADVFDEHDDLMVINKWRKDPALRQEFLDHLEDMGIVERKPSGSGYLIDVQGNMKLTWGAFNKVGEIMRDQQDQIDSQHDEIGELRESIFKLVAANAVHGTPNQLGA